MEKKQNIETMNKITVITVVLALSFFAMPSATLLAQEGATPTPASTPQPVAVAEVPATEPTPAPSSTHPPVGQTLPPAVEQEGPTVTEPTEPATEENSDQVESAISKNDIDEKSDGNQRTAAEEHRQILTALYGEPELINGYYCYGGNASGVREYRGHEETIFYYPDGHEDHYDQNGNRRVQGQSG